MENNNEKKITENNANASKDSTNDYNDRVNTNKKYINNYGNPNNSKNTNINNNKNNYTSDNLNNDENFKKVRVKVIATLICFAVSLLMYQNLILFLISMIFVIFLNEKSLKVIGRFIFLSGVVILIAFGACLLLILGAAGGL